MGTGPADHSDLALRLLEQLSKAGADTRDVLGELACALAPVHGGTCLVLMTDEAAGLVDVRCCDADDTGGAPARRPHGPVEQAVREYVLGRWAERADQVLVGADLAGTPYLAVPLLSHGRLVGGIVALPPRAGPVPREGDAQTLLTLAGPLALVLDNALLLQRTRTELEERRRAEATRDAALAREKLIADLPRLLAETTTDLGRAVDVAARAALEILGDACLVCVLGDDPDRWARTAVSHWDPAVEEQIADLFAKGAGNPREGLSAVIMQAGHIHVSQEEAAVARALVPERFESVSRAHEDASFAGVRLDARGRALGVLLLWRRTGLAPYTDQDLEIVRVVADRIAVHIDNARLLEQARGELEARRAAQAEVSAQASFHRSVLDRLPVGVQVLDAAGRTATVNAAVRRHLSSYGLPPETFSQVSVIEMLEGTEGSIGHSAKDAGACIRRVLTGVIPSCEVDVGAMTPRGEQWWHLQASALEGGGAVVTSVDISRRKENERALAHQASHDSLTGLPNRVLLEDRLEHALEHSHRQPGPLAVLFVDVDRFKLVNDGYGHPFGDQVLIEVARRLRSTLRPSDTVARFSGDEFVVVAEHLTDDTHAVWITERLLQVLAEPLQVDGREIRLTASIGVAMAQPDSDAGSLLREADAAMFEAKSRGRAGHTVFSEALGGRARRWFETVDALREGLRDNEFILHYQPVIELAGSRLHGVEALVRWQRHGGLLLPGSFIDVAEQSGLIHPLGDVILMTGCRQAAAWAAAARPLVVAINVSARQLFDGIAEKMARALEATGAPPSSVQLEITETALMSDLAAAGAAVAGLRSLGVGVQIDDFGTGYSSLAHLKHFRVDMLKIDRSFVAGLGRDSDDESIVHAVVDLAHGLGIPVTAEGIETPAQLEHVRHLGCDYAQGYHLGRPVPVEQLDPG